MKVFLRRVASGLGILIGAIDLGLSVLAYFVTRDCSDKLCDGFGRVLEAAPFVARFFLGQERLWAGFGWFALDFVVFFSGLFIASALLKFGMDASNGA